METLPIQPSTMWIKGILYKSLTVRMSYKAMDDDEFKEPNQELDQGWNFVWKGRIGYPRRIDLQSFGKHCQHMEHANKKAFSWKETLTIMK